MERVLVISADDTTMVAVLQRLGYTAIDTVEISGAERAVQATEYGLILADECPELCEMLLDDTFASVVLLVPQEMAAAAISAWEPRGVPVLEKPIHTTTCERLLRLAGATRARLLGLCTENRALQNKLDELRLVDRAKCAIIHYLGIDEKQAHRYIEKQAMDRRLSRTEVAREVIKTYEM